MKGRKRIDLDCQVLTGIINDLESTEKFPNRSALYNRVAEKLSEQGINVSSTHIYNHIKKFGIELVTVKADRASVAKSAQQGRAARKNRPKRSADNNIELEKRLLSRLKQTGMDRPANRTRVSKAVKGSKIAILQLHCLECVGGSPSDVKSCTVTNCFSYHIRPFRNKRGDISEGYVQPPLGEIVEAVYEEGLPE